MTRHKRKVIAVAVGVVVYVTPHFVLSRLSESRMFAYTGETGFFYYAPLDFEDGYERRDVLIHRGLRIVYFPLWQVDHALGGPKPSRSFPMMDVM